MIPKKSKSFVGVAMLVALCVSLTGCFNVGAKLGVHYDGTVSGTYSVSMDKSFAALLGATDINSFKALILKENDTAAAISPKDITFGETTRSFEARITVRNQRLTDDDLRTEFLPDGRLKLTFRNKGSEDWTPDQQNDYSMGSYNISLAWSDMMEPVEWSKEFLLNHSSFLLRIPINQPVTEAYAIFTVPKKLRGPFTLCSKGEQRRILKGKNRKCPKGFES